MEHLASLDYRLIALAVGLYVISCIFPRLAARTEDVDRRAYLHVFDALFTIVSYTLFALSFPNVLWGVVFALLLSISLGLAYRAVVGDDYINPYTRRPMRAKS